jgi:antitoxin component YwqK of YwqJK toxin-antitoxin module
VKLSQISEVTIWGLLGFLTSKKGVVFLVFSGVALLMFKLGDGSEKVDTCDWIDISKVEQRGDGLTYLIKKTKPLSGKVLEKYDDGSKEALIGYVEGMAHGLSVMWWPNGRKSAEVEFSEGKIVGKSKWDINGNLIK